MLEMVNVSIPNSNPFAGRRQSISLSPSLRTTVMRDEESMQLPQRRGAEVNSVIAPRSGVYLLRGIPFILTKGQPLPKKFDEIIYDDGTKPDLTGGLEAFIKRLAEDEAAKAAEDAPESAEDAPEGTEDAEADTDTPEAVEEPVEAPKRQGRRAAK